MRIYVTICTAYGHLFYCAVRHVNASNKRMQEGYACRMYKSKVREKPNRNVIQEVSPLCIHIIYRRQSIALVDALFNEESHMKNAIIS